MNLPSRVALCGYSQVGKDEAAKSLVALGYTRHNFGDIIKRQVDPLAQKYLGFSAFTEDAEQKMRIRRTLESWGEDNYDAILAEYLAAVPHLGRVVNTRLCRLREAEAWQQLGGIIVEIVRPGTEPLTEWENATMMELRMAGVIDDRVLNDSTVEVLWGRLVASLEEIQSCRR